MEFITDNYIWFIVAGVVLLMALIGYIADKTDFGRKKKEPKEEKKKEIKQEEPIAIQAKGLNDLTQPLVTESVEQVETTEPVENNLPFTDEDLFAPIATETTQEPVDASLYAPLETNDVAQEISNEVPTEVISEPVVDNTNLEQPLDQSLTQPLDQPVVIDSNVESEEDIWKF